MQNFNKIIKKLEGGSIPDSLSLIHWIDITEVSGAKSGIEVKPFEFMTVGFVLGKIGKVVYVQQTWEVITESGMSNDCRATQLILIPEGAIKKVVKFERNTET